MELFYKNDEWLRNQYDVEKMSILQIAKLCGVGRSSIRKRMIKIGIIRRDRNDYDRGGEKNGNWKGGIAHNMKLFRKSPEYIEWQKTIVSRDKGMCKITLLKPGEDVFPHSGDIAHHIFNVKENWEKRFDVNNGLCLCKSCHNKVHVRNGGEEGVSQERKETLYKEGGGNNGLNRSEIQED